MITFLHLLHYCSKDLWVAVAGVYGAEHGDEVNVFFTIDILIISVLATYLLRLIVTVGCRGYP